MGRDGDAARDTRSCKSSKELVQIGQPAAPVYWKSVEELHNGPHFSGEFPGGLATKEVSRRDFLALMGFTLAAASLSGCRAPVQNAIPLLVGSDQIIPGVSNFYATTCRGCASSCSLLVKQRDGRPINPHYSFDKARVIVGLEADFLGTWLSPVEFARQYSSNRKPEGTPALHIQFESGLSVTGSNADVRVPVAPSQLGTVAVALLKRIAHKAGVSGAPGASDAVDPTKLDAIADELWKHRGQSLVVSGSNDLSVQVVVNALNAFLGNIGKTVDLARPSLQRAGDDAGMAELVDEMSRGEVHTLILYGVNPGYDSPCAERFLKGLEQVTLSVSFADRRDETSSRVHAICPDHHFLEAWGDAEPVQSHFSLAQPVIAPLFETRAAQESLLRWLGQEQPNYYTYLQGFWRNSIFPGQTEITDSRLFWERSLQKGVVVMPSKPTGRIPALHDNWKAASRAIMEESQKRQAAGSTNRLALHFYESVGLRDGRHANNPWLQELPDPISKVSWGNYVAVAPQLAERLGLSDGDVVRVKTNRGQIELPVFRQPGQAGRTTSWASGTA